MPRKFASVPLRGIPDSMDVVSIWGGKTGLSKEQKADMKEVQTKKGTKGIFTVAISYGGRAEIVAATNALLASGVTSVDEEGFRAAMWSADLAYPDIIIRTGGDQRLSNFLAWQSAYSELFFPETKWPGFTKEEFDSILADYASRERRLGK